jgi:hypothetical protein
VNFNIPILEAVLPDRKVSFSVFCYGSQFSGWISGTPNFDNEIHAVAVVHLILRNLVDRLSFINMCGYDVDIVSMTDGSATQIVGAYEPVLFENIEDQVAHTHKLIPFLSPVEFTPHHLRLDHALRCFNHAMRDDALTTFFCYLAIETTARMIAEIRDGVEVTEMTSAAWEQFRQTLRLRRETIDADVKALADRFRHGDFVNTSWSERQRALRVTWSTIARAMHLVRGNEISESDFPLL